jgi:hypothetical protein
MAKKAKAAPEARSPHGAGLRLDPRKAAVLVFAATAVAAGAGLRLAVERLRGAAAELPHYRLSTANLEVTPVPAWIAPGFVERTLATADANWRDWSVADRDLPRRLSEAFASSPWVASASARIVVGGATVELKYRRPVLMAPWGGKACYVADDGVVLPPDEADREHLRRCLALADDGWEAPPNVGKKFADRRIADAAAFAAALAKARAEFDFLRIRPLNRPDEPFACELHTVGGSVVRWGEVRAHEFDSKIARLRSAATFDGKLSEANSPLFFDLTAPGRTLVGVPLAR